MTISLLPLLQRVASLTMLLVVSSSLAFAQPDIFNYGGAPVEIPDDGYDGSMGSMACVDLDNSGGVVVGVSDVSMDMEITHTWVGDLTIKVMSPTGTVTTAMATPGQPGAPDDGSTCCGNNDDLDGTPINFADSNPTDAENMGLGGVGVCTGDGLCNYFPNPDGAPGTDFSDFDGEDAVGTWTVCVGDGAAGDLGEILDFTLTVDGSTVSNEPGAELPDGYSVSQAYPNPFNPQTQLIVEVGETQNVVAEVFNALGQKVATIHDGVIAAGQSQTLTFEAGTLPSGLYVVRVAGEAFTTTRSVSLLK